MKEGNKEELRSGKRKMNVGEKEKNNMRILKGDTMMRREKEHM